MVKSVINWNEDNVAILKANFADNLTCKEIAAKLGPGFTRNAVIGKLYRMNMRRFTIPNARGVPHVRKNAPSAPSAPTLILRTPKMIEARQRRAAAGLPPVTVKIPAPVVLEGVITLFKLNSGMCKYVIGPNSYCGHDQRPGHSYCPHHYQITHMFRPA